MRGIETPPAVVDARPGRLLARGREATVHELDAGRVLRRYDDTRDVTAEVAIMRHVADHGVRVPRVHGVHLGPDGRCTGMVLERLDGPSLVAAALGGALGPGDVGRMLARLHARLHRVPVAGLAVQPGVLPAAGPPRPDDVVVHLDLHPANVVLAGGAPVVIDWAMARTGPAGLDTATTALTLAAAAIAGVPADAGDVARLAVPAGFVRSILDAYLADLATAPTAYLDRAATVLDRTGAQQAGVVRAAVDLVRQAVVPPGP